MPHAGQIGDVELLWVRISAQNTVNKFAREYAAEIREMAIAARRSNGQRSRAINKKLKMLVSA